MHILYIHQYFCPPGGAGNNRSFDLARAWVRAGHRVTMLCSTAYFPASVRAAGESLRFDCEGIEVVALDVAYGHMMPFWQRVRSFLRFYRSGLRAAKGLEVPDIVYASSTPPTVGEMGRRLAARWGRPFVFETVDVWPDVPIGMGIVRNRWLAAWLHRRVDRIYHAAAAVVALSDGMRAQVMARGVPAAKVRLSYNGTDLEAFPFVERVAGKQVRLIYTGTVGLANGVSAIVRLCKRLAELGRTDISCTVVGGGNDWARVKALAESHQLTNLAFIDTVPKEEVHALLAAADIGLVTFAPFKVLEANSANKFYDYLASGLPIVTNYEGWQATYLRAHDCGRAVPMGDDAAFLQAVLALADDGALRAGMGRRARALAEAHFDRKRLAAELLGLFQEVVG